MIEPLLEHTTLIDIGYLVALGEAGGVIPAWKDVPDSARINSRTVWRLRAWNLDSSLPVLVLSYPWLDRHHPDRNGEQLKSLLPVLKSLHSAAQATQQHATVGVLWDYMSLPQGERTPSELERFTKARHVMHAWYGHPYTTTLVMARPLPYSAAYSNTRPYEKRGWTLFERRLSSLVKHDGNYWDMRKLTPPSASAAPLSYSEVRQLLSAAREPVASPKRMARLLREGVASNELAFTALDDLELVVELYARGFVHAVDTYGACLDGARRTLLSQHQNASSVVAAHPTHSRTGTDSQPSKEHVVADSVFSKVAGAGAGSVSLTRLSDYLIGRGDMPLDKVQALFNQLDTNGDGTVDRQEWRAGFTAGLVPT